MQTYIIAYPLKMEGLELFKLKKTKILVLGKLALFSCLLFLFSLLYSCADNTEKILEKIV